MINQAMFVKRDHFNEFTAALRMLCDNDEKQRCLVKLRNGTLMYVKFQEAEDETETTTFYSEGWSKCWRLDGSSVTADDYDIVAFGSDV